MAGAWHGGFPGVSEYVKDASLESAILLGMRWWFDRDFTNPACLDNGGSASCPCNSTETLLWNTNWYSNVGSNLLKYFSIPQRLAGHRSAAVSGGRVSHHGNRYSF